MLRVPAQALELTPHYGKVFCERSWKWNTTGRPFTDYAVWYVWSGEGDLSLNGLQRPVRAGTCHLFQPGDEVIGAHDPGNPLTVSYVHFCLSEGGETGCPSRHVIQDRVAFETYLTRYVHARIACKNSDETEARLLLYLLLWQLNREAGAVGEPDRTAHPAPRSDIREVADYVRQFPGTAHNVSALAERARLSERYFSRKFRAVMGRSVESYLIETRIERAEHLLRCYGMNVSEVADALGYGSVYYFSRQFKQWRGVAPSEVRGRQPAAVK